MNRLILAIFLLFSSLSATQSWASGSNTVFLPVKSRQYYMMTASNENVGNAQLQSYIERVEERVYIAQLTESVFSTTAYYAMNGYDVRLDFEALESITFRYYASVDAIIGFTSYDNPVILNCGK
ncbi:MAG TPA: hypothetical protein VE954_20220 [Oligoflexus sp.]|uniref:hypothetical protein n=1 Tax=Oligoflexus sp. TaxID=1971216 RepID=UPI002D2ACC1B|nr:hypothetical protein [Oligoflexus sp.]HYX35429.1 hypothetical protein [Oligoflexus sp.]